MTCQFVPPYLLQQLASHHPGVSGPCTTTLAIDERFRTARSGPPRSAPAGVVGSAAWTVHTAAGGSTLPGTKVRAAGEPESGDAAVDEAAYGITGSLALFAEVYGRASYDGNGAPVSLTVHYEQDYDNAFWDGTQLVFGDGDGTVFGRFTKPVDVLGHEFTHAVTEHTAGLAYAGQSGALNESMSDVFAACLKQRLLGQDALEADWLIGEGIFVPGISARGLRDMAAPGTAYDDPALGKDPQGADMSAYVETTDDNGGVHLNSGIPNRAFQLAAVAIGGSSWEGAGAVWYAALTGGAVGARTDFAGFAAATVAAAGAHADAVRGAWETVGVTPAGAAAGSGAGAPGVAEGDGPAPSPARTVSVRRTGGFAGLAVGGEVDLDGDDPRGSEVRSLMDRIDLREARTGLPHPDMFVYDFDLCGERARVPEQHLTDDLRRLAEVVLG
ncbi:M4 family metallopeptidase [Nocardioides sp. KIGAM211]|uniref:Neutral metalloproteinase n=1 Tax=Nocardioides luti TaxID=2761101 RepID=A0A7X0RHS9_9ACTN|nr:protealysin inhibitor emfourin [Nocardioides luti]MBB6628563.1 M4 family metallopeptidase [Nocardioides luti]